MNKFSEQNAITRRIDMMCEKWNNTIDKDNTKLVRWLCDPDELRMVDAFCLTEGSTYGTLDDLFLRFTTSIDKSENYDRLLIEEWLANWHDEKSRKAITDAGIIVSWDDTHWVKALADNHPASFLKCINDFANAVEGLSSKLVIYIKPLECKDSQEWVSWVNTQFSNGIPERVRLMISDINGYELFKKTDKSSSRVSILANLNMAQAIREIATSGDPNNPGVAFNTCIFNMNEAMAQKNYADVDLWGQKAIDIGHKSGNMSLEATGALSYGAALMLSKNIKSAMLQFVLAQNLAKTGHEKGDEACKPILLYSYTFEAALNMQSKQYSKALLIYTNVCALANEMKNYLMAADSSYMAAMAAKKISKYEVMHHHLTRGLDFVKDLSPDNAKYSTCLMLGKELVEYAKLTHDNKLNQSTNDFLTPLWGEGWLLVASHSEQSKKDYPTMLGFNIFNLKN